jgi:hypothetical protein
VIVGRPRRLAVIGLCLLPQAGCLGVADERARRDEQVGRASAGGVTVTVDEGLAAVHTLDPDGLVLWAQAPELGIALDRAGAPAPFAVTVENALPDAELRLEDGSPVPAQPAAAGDPPTLKRWRLDALARARLQVRAPDRDSRETFRFAAYADVQEALPRVQDIYQRMATDPRIRFAVMNGDLTDMGAAVDLQRFQREMRTLPFPVYATLGNHELGVAGPPFHPLFGRGSFSFAFRSARFTLLDSASATLAPAVHDWLDGWLRAGAGAFHLVTMHIPPLDPIGTRNGGFASRLEADQLLGRLAAFGVDLTIYGHVHSFYAFANAGIPAYISGGGGGIPERLDGIGRHFLTIDVDPTTQKYQVAIVRVD